MPKSSPPSSIPFLNIRNILALRGDPPAGSKEGWDGDYKYAYRLVEQIKNLNQGKYLPKSDAEGPFVSGMKTDFCIMVAGHPEDPIDVEIEHIKAKIDCGAEAIITQMVFSFEEYKNYVDALRKNGINIPVLPGIRPVMKPSQIDSLEKFFGLKVCDELRKGIDEGGEDFGMAYFIDFIKKLKDYGAPGAHFFIFNGLDIFLKMIEKSDLTVIA